MTRTRQAISRKRESAPRPHTAAVTGRAAVVDRRAADRLRAGHPWVYASDVVEVTGEERDAPAGLIPVADQRGIPLGTALYSPQSQIVLRLVSRELFTADGEWLALIETRLRRALGLRATMQTEACRLVFSEADELPGLIIDRYGTLVLIQILVRGLDRPEVRELLTRVLVEEIAPETVIERGDARIAALEGLQTPALETLYAKDPAHPTCRPPSSSTGCASPTTPPPDRRPEPSLTSASTTQPPLSMRAARLWTSAPTREVSPSTWRQKWQVVGVRASPA